MPKDADAGYALTMILRRDLLLQIASAATLAACGAPPSPKESTTDATDDSVDTAAPEDDTSATTDSAAPDTADTPDPEALCGDEQPLPTRCVPTSPDGEGPYFREDAPVRTELNIAGLEGVPLVLAGRVLDARCLPQADLRVYLWSADPMGRYDDQADDPNLYGQTVTDAGGNFCFRTLRPVPYGPPESRLPAHLHLNFFRGATKVFTTQLRFAGDPYLPTAGDTSRNVTPEILADGTERIRYDFVLPDPPL